ncbi:hypothetical protein U0O11_10740 [Cobetia sp. D5]|uniref:hypothetical protein n=1 Tax=Cobetia sp. D5 TaxID=3105867 RepID=UPI002D7936FC|nr:hypothetical protein [Cobetia sp. D5]
MTKKHIAICISGMIRSDFETIPSLNFLIEKLEKIGYLVDVFIHTWSIRQVYAPGGMNKIERRVPKIVLEMLPPEYRNLEAFEKYFPKTFSLLEKPIFDDFDSKILERINNLRLVKVETQESFHRCLDKRLKSNIVFKNSLNQANMFYGMFSAFDLARQYSAENSLEYSAIFRMRPDTFIVRVDEDLLENELNDKKIRSRNISEIGCGDVFFFGPPKNMYSIIELWESIENNKSTDLFGDGQKRFAEPLLAEWFKSRDINYDIVKSIHATLPMRFVNEVNMQHPDLVNTLEAEAQMNSVPFNKY